jgi:hypothetical protein
MTSDSEIKRLIRFKNDTEYKLKKVRSECKHIDRVMKFTYNCGYSSGNLRWTCSLCETIVGYPKEEEIKTFLKNK